MASYKLNIVVVGKDDASQVLGGVGQAVRRVGDAAEEGAKRTKGASEMMTGALRRVGEMGVNLLAEAGQAIVSYVATAVDGAADYEQSMNVFQAQSGATAAQMDAVKEKAKALGADLTLPATSAASAGEAMLELSKAGMSVEQSMEAAKGTLQLAAAAQIDEASAASISANALNTFHLQASQAGYVADLLAASANASSASMTDLADGFKQGGFAFSAANQKIDDLAASLAILTNVGLTGSDSGTALKNAMMKLMNPTAEASDLMAHLGINVYDAQGKMRPMRDIIGILNTAMAGMTQQERNSALATIFLSDGMKAMIPLLDGGVDGFDKMKAAVNQQGAAAKLAEAQMQGLHGAVAGLSSQLETLMLEALEPLLPLMTAAVQQAAAFASSFIGQVGPAVQTAIDVGGALVNVVQSGLVPALGVAAAATLVWAAANAGPLLLALTAAAPQIIAATSAVVANAAAVAAAAAPYLLIAAAVAAVAVHWTAFTQKLDDGTQALLNSHPAWVATTQALESYNNQSAETQAQLASHAGTIQVLRGQIEEEIKSLALRDAAGLVSDEQREREKAHINELGASLTVATNAYNTEEQALISAAAAKLTATARAEELANGTNQIAIQATLTADELEKLAKKLGETYEKGAEAVSTYVTTEAGFLAQAAQLRDASHAEELQKQAASYAAQQAAQQAHLGQMLTDYTAAQIAMGNISAETGQKIMQEIQQSFGIVHDTSAITFADMAQAIDDAAARGGSALSGLDSRLSTTADEAVATKQKMDELSKQYEAELVHNFQQGKIDAQQLADQLKAIPERVYSEVVTHHIDTYESRGDNVSAGGVSGYRASGGPVSAGELYVVGEQGPELFLPDQGGTIIPNDILGGLGGSGGAALAPATPGATINNYYGDQVLNYQGVAGEETDVRAALRMQAFLMR